jgi:hypothetical protein
MRHPCLGSSDMLTDPARALAHSRQNIGKRCCRWRVDLHASIWLNVDRYPRNDACGLPAQLERNLLITVRHTVLTIKI